MYTHSHTTVYNGSTVQYMSVPVTRTRSVSLHTHPHTSTDVAVHTGILFRGNYISNAFRDSTTDDVCIFIIELIS